jgi:hypothetical protein
MKLALYYCQYVRQPRLLKLYANIVKEFFFWVPFESLFALFNCMSKGEGQVVPVLN